MSSINFGEVKLDNITKILYEKLPSSSACHNGTTFIEKNGIRRVLLDFGFKETNKFTGCIIDVKKINDINVRLFICYRDGAGSGECSSAVIDYNIKHDKFTFVGYYEYVTD